LEFFLREIKLMERNVKGWLEHYIEFMKNTEPAAVFDKWTGHSMIAAALRKKVKLPYGRINYYPNLYIVFVAEPGIARKTQAISFGVKLLQEIPDVVMSADQITKEALLQDLEAAGMDEPMPDGENLRHSSLSIISKEFESFIGQKKDNTKMIVFLTDMFDCAEMPTKYRTKNSGSNVIPSVFVNLLAATTPESLASCLPATAVGGGLTSRILFIWAEDKKCKSPKPSMTASEKKLQEALIKDLYQISRIAGNYSMSSSADEFWYNWYMHYDEKSPNRICLDKSFAGWYARKPTYILKMAINRAASETNELVIDIQHIQQAIADIESVEANMGLVFRAIGKSDITSEVDNIAQLIYTYGTISEHKLMALTWRDIDSNKFDNCIKTVLRTGTVERFIKGPKSEIWYRSLKK
jgi:hypothetical protein